jgi:hypothetical protein
VSSENVLNPMAENVLNNPAQLSRVVPEIGHVASASDARHPLGVRG